MYQSKRLMLYGKYNYIINNYQNHKIDYLLQLVLNYYRKVNNGGEELTCSGGSLRLNSNNSIIYLKHLC